MLYEDEKFEDLLNKREIQFTKKIKNEININDKFNFFIEKEIKIPIKLNLIFDDIIIKEQFDWDISWGVSIEKFCIEFGNKIEIKKEYIEIMKEDISEQILNYVSNYKERDNKFNEISLKNDEMQLNNNNNSSLFLPYFDFLKKKCELCNKLSYKFNQQCKNCRLFLIHTKDLVNKSKQYKYTLKFMENLIFHSDFIDDELISRIKKSSFESINIILKILNKYFKFEEEKWNFIKKYSLCFIKNYEENVPLEFEDDEKVMLGDLLKKTGKNDSVFELKEKPKSRRGAHLIGLGRNIKHLKKEIEYNKKKDEFIQKKKYEEIEKEIKEEK